MSILPSRQGTRVPTDEEFAFLLEDRAFVDYFNVFLTLPVFGQQIFYNFVEKGFVYDPPIKKKRNFVDRRCVIAYLIQERYPIFEKTTLFLEYLLCCRLRDVEVDFESKTFKEESEKRTHFSRNVLGHVLGMQMFREFIRGTAGENIFKCWMEIERWKLSEGTTLQRTEMAHDIKITYLSVGSQRDLRTRGKRIVFEGRVDFELIPEREIQDELLQAVTELDVLYTVETIDAFDNLQRILLSVLRRYWVPRYFIHLYNTVSAQTLGFLMKETPFDIGTVAQQRKLRCQIMFPRIYSASRSSPGSPTTPVFLSCDADRLPEPAYSVTSSDVHAPTPDVEIPSNCSERNVDPFELLSLWSGQGYSAQRNSTKWGKMKSAKKDEVDDAYGLKELEVWEKAESSRFLRGSPMLYIIPLPVNSYVRGRRRINFDSTTLDRNNKMAAAFASDVIAGFPFRQFLQDRQLIQDARMLEFWTDVRHYMDADDAYLDPFGIPMRRKLARVLVDKFLTLNNDLEYDIFSEELKITLYQSLNSRDDVTLMSFAQTTISHALKESWRLYSREERTSFRMKVCGSKRFDRNIIEVPPRSASARGQSDPLFYVNSNTQSPTALTLNDAENIPAQSTSPQQEASTTYSRVTSELANLTLTPEISLKALEYAILCTEYGRSGVSSQVKPKLEDLIDVLYSDYGSLHIKREPAKRHEFLYNLLHKPKIDIETIKVSRQVILESPEVTAIEKNQYRSRLQRLVLRRRGILIERPTRPRNFIEVLQSPVHYEFFKRYMMGNKTVHPLLFWKYVEDLKEAQSARHRNHLISNIYRKFFSKTAKQGYLLDCSDDIIRQIPTMERIPASVLICAQASVFRSMERKWFPRYMETYPVDADYPPPEQTESTLAPSPTFNDLTEQLVVNKEAIASKKKTTKKRKTLHLWHGFLQLIIDFMDALRDEYEFRLLELYLRNEQDKDSKRKRVAEKSLLTSSTVAAFQTRVVLRNRLVIVNKLVADLHFWNEVQKFKKHIDEISTRENITKEDMDFLQQKAKAIIDCYLLSEVVPRVQVNIPSDLATSIAVSLTQSGPTRGLFHDAMILIFPLLYYFWKRFRDEWLKGHDPKDFYFRLKEKLTVPWVSSTPHKDLRGPSYINVRESQCQMMAVNLHEDEPFRINFTVMGGIRYMFSNRATTKPATVQTTTVDHGRRYHHARRTHRDSISRSHRIQAEDATHGEHKYSRHDMKKKSKIILEDEESVRNLDQGDIDVKSEKSVEIQKTEDSAESSSTTLSPRRRRQSAAVTNQSKAFRISQLVEELNSESDRPIAQRLRTLDQVVRAALSTQTRSQFADDITNSITSLLN